MWYYGLLDLSAWQLVGITLLMTHVTIVSVTVYLHRYSAHRALELNGALKHFFRFWLWLTTAQNTREWTAIHRKHHAKCETPDDPHSPVHKGLGTVLRKGAELYREEARNPETLRIYGKNCPDDWIERNLYSRYKLGGIALMAVIDLLLFGTIGITIWAVQMMWIPFWAAGVVNGLGHALGYRNFECRDAATNLVPWGIVIGGEELHNNHHTYPNSAKLSVKRWEFDMGWAWIRLFCLLRLAKVQRVAPIAHRVAGKASLDMDTAMAILNNRFQIMAQYRKLVIGPLVKQELARVDASVRHHFRRAKRLLSRETSLLEDRHHVRIESMLAHSQALKTIYEKRLALQQIWARTSANGHDMLSAMKDWIHEAETSGIHALRDFAAQLKTYSLRPTGA
ncbi:MULTISPECIES: delta-9 fatty acid desaturase DesA [Pseudomonas]|jgi:stearoyl-CoA desaturase (delta-9 desaturase)|uniref:Acyl-CoA desaturase n=2 Tax=Pseudomonas putida TaxID=303 RepID=A0A1X0ZIJ8_PSEPU|nr:MULTISPECIES: delta-9 fatty acid desaturase DesA [Pseudomonas]MDN5675121.1 delta-9 fatty acid desaturase DesA [Pseudomonas sp.]EKT4461671.1 delta-9 fatty acid desaturase DesA [Pseudomonas putida]EKT4554386.1 delta-9 fatty acid desaturase DesA [Pseudomonas putida]ELF6209338.1 delta-9 fatty acid desaturase DesA [Pseudomonas putida]KAF0255532.1 acyl-CoA desaturase [Pseudomonas putida]